jgi:NADH:ubiquinone oxidoreductase subunit
MTATRGKKVGEDSQGNIYYTDKKGERRWVIYKNGGVEASRIPPEWHGWMHKTINTPPSESVPAYKSWEKEHQPNLTGTKAAYVPKGFLHTDGSRVDHSTEYEAWRP